MCIPAHAEQLHKLDVAPDVIVLHSEAASVFLLHEHAVWGTRADISNFEPHPLDLYVLTADLALGGN